MSDEGTNEWALNYLVYHVRGSVCILFGSASTIKPIVLALPPVCLLCVFTIYSVRRRIPFYKEGRRGEPVSKGLFVLIINFPPLFQVEFEWFWMCTHLEQHPHSLVSCLAAIKVKSKIWKYNFIIDWKNCWFRDYPVISQHYRKKGRERKRSVEGGAWKKEKKIDYQAASLWVWSHQAETQNSRISNSVNFAGF